jgi:hypothetical protein
MRNATWIDVAKAYVDWIHWASSLGLPFRAVPLAVDHASGIQTAFEGGFADRYVWVAVWSFGP